MTRRERERDIEAKAVKLLREQGAKVAKLNLLGQRGWPDRLAVAPNGAHCWLEFKKPGEDLTALQAELRRDFGRRGITVHTVRSVMEALLAYDTERQRWQLTRNTLAIAEEAREALGLASVAFVPAAVSPFKADREATAPEHRLAMVRAAIADNPSFTVSAVELERPGPSFTVDTLATFAAAGAGPDGLWLILSSEALAGFPRWRQPSRILDLARLAVVPRSGFDPLGPGWVAVQFPGREDRFAFLGGPLLPISGSVVRRRAAAGRSVRYLVPEPVRRRLERE